MTSAIIKAVVPIKATLEDLYRRCANLFTVDVAITFKLKKLKDGKSLTQPNSDFVSEPKLVTSYVY